MDQQELLSGLALELRRGTIVLCVLSQLRTPMYGYNLISTLSEAGLPVEANTLYPLLRRLEGQGLLTSAWEVGENKPRKYYSVTDIGLEIYGNLERMWRSTVKSMNKLLEGEANA